MRVFDARCSDDAFIAVEHGRLGCIDDCGRIMEAVAVSELCLCHTTPCGWPPHRDRTGSHGEILPEAGDV